MKKVHLILIDGMRPDALAQCGNPYARELLESSACALEARTVFPPVTLPCHMSLFYSVEPGRHGVTDNHFAPMARPLNGIMEQVHGSRSTAMCYNWAELRDICRPGYCDFSFFISAGRYGRRRAARTVCEASEKLLAGLAPDFCFTYVGWPDDEGHDAGWMSGAYMQAVNESIGLVWRVIKRTEGEYFTILVADHGGHDRSHGDLIDEDMLIPVLLHGEGIRPGELQMPVSILDIAPTVASLLDCEPAAEWEGRPLV